MLKCTQCGELMPENTEICPRCGHPADFIFEQEPTHAPAKGRYPKGCLWLAVFILIVIFLGITNPGKDKHHQIVQNRIESCVEELRDSMGISTGLAFIGEMIVDNITKVVLGNKFSVDNYVVCSVGKFHHKDKSTMITFGMVNHVWCFVTKDDLKGYVNKWKQEKREDAAGILSGIKRMFGFGGDDAPATSQTPDIDEDDLFNSNK